MSDQANIQFGHIPIPGIMSVILELSSALLLFSLPEEESKLIWTIKETTAHISSASTVSVIAKLSALHTTAQMAVSGRKKAYLNHLFLFLPFKNKRARCSRSKSSMYPSVQKMRYTIPSL